MSQMRQPQPMDMAELVQKIHSEPEPRVHNSQPVALFATPKPSSSVVYRLSLSRAEYVGTRTEVRVGLGEEERREDKGPRGLGAGRAARTRGNSKQRWPPAW